MKNLMTIEVELEKAARSTGMTPNGVDSVSLMNAAEDISDSVSMFTGSNGFVSQDFINRVCHRHTHTKEPRETGRN